MPEWTPTIWLFVQGALTIVTIDQFRRRVFPFIADLQEPESILDVWAPLAMVIPMMFFVGRVNVSVRGVGWIPLGGPATCGLIALGASMAACTRLSSDLDWRNNWTWRLRCACTGTGVLLLMLGAAHNLTLWIGQCAFAIGALLMWMNSPELRAEARSGMSTEQARAGVGMTVAMLGAIGQGAAALLAPREFAPISGALMIAGAAAVSAAAARSAGPGAAARIGGWAATYGVLLSLGLLSVMRLVPHAIETIRDNRTTMIKNVASGFGAYGFEAMVMILLTAMVAAIMRWPRLNRRRLGAALIIAGAVLAAWRLGHI